MKKIAFGLILLLASFAANAYTLTAQWSAYTAPTGVTVTLHLFCAVGTGTQADIGNVASTLNTMTATIAASGGQVVNCTLHAQAVGYNDGVSLPASVTVATPTLAAPTGLLVF